MLLVCGQSRAMWSCGHAKRGEGVLLSCLAFLLTHSPLAAGIHDLAVGRQWDGAGHWAPGPFWCPWQSQGSCEDAEMPPGLCQAAVCIQHGAVYPTAPGHLSPL